MAQQIEVDRVMTILHLALTGGLAAVGVVFALVAASQGGALTPGVPSVGVILAGVALLILLPGVGLFAGRLPPRRRDQSPAAYWEDPQRRGTALVLWAVAEGAGMVGFVGYLLSGGVIPLAVGALALGVLLWFRPGRMAA